MHLRKNIVAMYILRGTNYILPLVYIPYLLATIGLGQYGLLAFYTAICSLAIPIIEYGFNTTGIKDIIDQKNNKEESIVYSEIFWIRIFLSTILTIFLTLMVLLNFVNEIEILFFTLLSVVAQSLFPGYIFQAKRQMSLIAIINVTTKLVSTGVIFIIVESPSDTKWVPLLTLVGAICSSAIGYALISIKYKLKIQKPEVKALETQIKRGGRIFLTNASATLYNAIGPISLGLVGMPNSVGIYSLGEKVLQATKGLYLPLLSGVYSDWIISVKSGDSQNLKKIRKILWAALAIIILFVPVAAYFANRLSLNSMNELDVNTLIFFGVILAVAPIDYLRNIFGNMILIPRGEDRIYLKIMKTSAVLGTLLIFLLATTFGAMGAAWGLLLVELGAMISTAKSSMRVKND